MGQLCSSRGKILNYTLPLLEEATGCQRTSLDGWMILKSYQLIFLIVIFFSLLAMGCRNEHHHDHHQATGSASASATPSAQTLAMIDSVKKAQAAVDPMKVTVFMSAERAQILKQRVESNTGLNKLNFMVMYGF